MYTALPIHYMYNLRYMYDVHTTSPQGEVRDQYVSELVLGQQPMERVKLLVCGGPGVGKTELVDSLKCHILRSLFRRRSTSNLQQAVLKRTYGVSVQHATVPGAGLFSVWDFSGMREFYVAHEHFLDGSNGVFLLVVNLRDPTAKQLAQARFWLSMIKARRKQRSKILAKSCERRPFVILVGSFADQQQLPYDDLDFHGNDVFAVPIATSVSSPPDNGRGVLDKLSKEFGDFFDFSNTVFAMDCRLSQSVEMRSLRSLLGSLHTRVIKVCRVQLIFDTVEPL